MDDQYYQPPQQGQNPNPYEQNQGQYGQNPNPYGQPVYPPTAYPPYDPTNEVMSVGQYIGLFILSAIPVVNIICWIVWLVSPDTNKNKKNFLIAQIVMSVLSAVIITVIGLLGYTFGAAAFSGL